MMKIKIIKIMEERDKCKVPTEGLVLAWLRSRRKVTDYSVKNAGEKKTQCCSRVGGQIT